MNDQDKSPYEGLAFAAALWLWGSVAWIAPSYIGFGGIGMWVCNIVGGILIAVSFGGAAMEVGSLFKSEAFEWWGVGMVFLVPGALLHFAVWYAELGAFWGAAAKSMALLLDAFGGTFILLGLAYLFWHGPPVGASDKGMTPEAVEEREAEEKRRRRQYAASAGVFLLIVISAILKTVFGVA